MVCEYRPQTTSRLIQWFLQDSHHIVTILFNLPADVSLSLPFPGLGLRLIHGSLCSPKSTLQLLHGLPMCNRQTDTLVVFDGPEVTSWTHAVHLGRTDISSRYALPASSPGDLVVPSTCRRISDRAISVAAPRAWNRLPTEFKLLQLTTTFCHQLKTVLFQSAYGHWETDR